MLELYPLRIGGVRRESHYIDILKGEAVPPEFLAINPKGVVSRRRPWGGTR